MINCPNKPRNMQDCNCSYTGCAKTGICCECVRYHRSKGALPACYFPADVESGYDRSIDNFIKVYQARRHL